MLLLLTTIDLGRLMYSQITITNAAKEGALVASQGGTYQNNQPCSDTNEVMCGAITEAKGGFVEVDKARVTLTPATCVKDAMYPSTGAPPSVSVSVQAPFRVITPIVSSIIGSNLVLNSTAKAQCLVVPAVTYPSIPAPTAVFTATPQAGSAPLAVSFNASGSSSPGATITTYAWTYGSGQGSGTGVSPSKTYTIDRDVHGHPHGDRQPKQDGDGIQDDHRFLGGPPPVCPTLSFTALTAVTRANRIAWISTEAFRTDRKAGPGRGRERSIQRKPGQNLNNHDFATGGPQSVTLSATKGACSITVTQTVNVP